jgi:hypothetical protein
MANRSKRAASIDWTTTATGREKYAAARAEAQTKANVMSIDVGIERNDLFKSFHVFLLPAVKYRSGHEIRCEVVSPVNAPAPVYGSDERCRHCGNPLPGHGYTC